MGLVERTKVKHADMEWGENRDRWREREREHQKNSYCFDVIYI